MDFTKLSQVADSLREGKSHVSPIVQGREVKDQKNPLDSIDVREKITDSEKVIIVDSIFIKKLKEASRSKRRALLARLTDSQRKRVLNMLKRVADSAESKLGYITLDTLLANYVYDPSQVNKSNIENFVRDQRYFEYTQQLQDLVQEVLEGITPLSEEGLSQLESGLEGTPSRLAAFSGEVFEVPEEEELTEEDITTLQDAAKEHAKLWQENHNFTEIRDAAEDLLAEFQGKNRDYKKSSEIYWKQFDEASKEQYEEQINKINDAADTLESILDDKNLDQVFDNPAMDKGEEVKDTEDRSILSLLTEALESYADGDSDKLDALLEQTMIEQEDEEPEEENEEEDADEEQEDEEPEEEVDEEEFEEVTEENEDKVKDSVHRLVKRLKQGKKVNKLVDSLLKVCPSLSNYNLKVVDCGNFCTEVPACTDVVADIPLSCEEYHALLGDNIPAVVACAFGEEKCPVWPFNNWSVEGDCINADGRYYKPYACSLEEVQKRLEEAADDPSRQEIVGSTCVPLSNFRYVAAKCDALNLIDTRFYRPSVASKSWKFKGNLKDIVDAEGTTLTRCTKDESNIMLFGSPYKLS